MNILQSENHFAGYGHHLQSKVPPVYLPPRFVWLSDDAAGSNRNVTFEAFVERIAGEPTPQTWHVRGYPGSGKTSFTHALAAELLSRGTAALLLRPHALSQIADAADLREVVKQARPVWVTEEQVWKARARKGRIVIIIDAVNDIERWYQGTPVARLVERILFGSHPFPVVATSRRELDTSERDDSFRPINELVVAHFDADDQHEYLSKRGIDADSGLRTFAAAGLAHAATNPFLLALAATLLSEHGTERLARTRAELFVQTLRHAKDALSREENRLLESGPTLEAMLAATAVDAAFRPEHAGTFSHDEVTSLLRKVWDEKDIGRRVDVFMGSYLVKDDVGSSPGFVARGRRQFIHDSMIDFGVALALRRGGPPPLAFLQDANLDNLLGDWVGLQDDIDTAAEQAVAGARLYDRRDLLIDVLVANRGRLSDDWCERLWLQIGHDLMAHRSARDRVAQRLALLSPDFVRESVSFGMLRALGRDDSELAQIVRHLLQKGAFGAEVYQRQRRWLHRRRRARVAGGGTGTLPQAYATSPVAVRLESELTDADPVRRARAATRLGQLKERHAVDPLMAALSDAVGRVRGAAANALGLIGERTAAPLLTKLLADPDAFARGSAATALGNLSDHTALEVLIGAAKDEGDVVRAAVATALGKIGDRSALPVLITALEDQADNVRGSAAMAIGTIGDRRAVAALLRALDDDDARVRGSAATALGMIGDRSAVPALLGALADGDAKVRGSSATALGTIGDRSTLAQLARTLERDSAARVRASAATALATIGDRSAVPPLANALSDPEPYVRGAAATALGAIGDRSAVVAVSQALDDHDAAVRGAAATALGAIGDRSAVTPLLSALDDDVAYVRGSAATALGAIGDRAAVAALSRLLTDPDVLVRSSAATALGSIGDAAVVPPLKEALRDETMKVQSSAATALRRAGDPSVIGDLLQCVEDVMREPFSRAAALNALLQLSSSWPPALETWFESERAIGLPGPVKGKLIEGLQRFPPSARAIRWLDKTARHDRDPASRTGAVNALAAHGKVTEATARFLIDPSFERYDKRRYDTDRGVQGATAAAVMRSFADGGEPSPELLRAAIALLTDETVHIDALKGALAPLSRLDYTHGSRALRILDEAAAAIPSGGPLREHIARQQGYLDRREQLLQSFRTAQAQPETLLVPLRDTDRLWFDKPREREMDRKTAILVTSNEREGRVLYRALCETSKSEKLPLERVGSRFAFDARLHCQDGTARRVLLVQLHDIGPLPAQAAFGDLLRNVSPRVILFVGCCGALAEKNGSMPRGTVVVPRQVFDYERRTLRDGQTLYAEPAHRTPRLLLDLVRSLSISGEFGELAVVSNKDYASGSAFIDDAGARLRIDLVEEFPKDVCVVDMEGHAVLHAFWESGAASDQLLAGIVKGVSDGSSGDGTVDEVARQEEATKNAARVALEILRALPD